MKIDNGEASSQPITAAVRIITTATHPPAATKDTNPLTAAAVALAAAIVAFIAILATRIEVRMLSITVRFAA